MSTTSPPTGAEASAAPADEQSCAGAIVHDADGRLLLIQRGTAPSRGSWSVPGGRCEPGETTVAACVREAMEETGLTVRVLALAGTVRRDRPGGGVYVIDDYACEVVGGELRPGDDADDARWVARTDMDRLQLAPGLIEALAGWGLLPRV